MQFRYGCRVSGLKRAGRTVRGVLLDGSKLVEANAVISNVDRITTRAWLGDLGDYKPSLSYFTMHRGLRDRPRGVAHYTLCVPSGF